MPVIRKSLRLKNKKTIYGATEKILSTTPNIAILSTQNSLTPGTTKSLHTTPNNNGTVLPSQNYLHTTPGTKKSLHTTPGNNGTVPSSQNYQQTTLDNTSTINDNMEYLQTILNSFSNHSTEKFKTPPTTPVIHETVQQDVPINALELQLTPIRDYIRCLEHQLNQAMKKIETLEEQMRKSSVTSTIEGLKEAVTKNTERMNNLEALLMPEQTNKSQEINESHENEARTTQLDTLLIGDINLTNVESRELDIKSQVRTISKNTTGEMKKWLQSRENIYAKKYIIHLSNQEVFNFSEDRKNFEKLNDLINYINEKKNPEDIIISSPLPFNKTGNIHTKIEGFMTSLTKFCSEKNIKCIDNRSFVDKIKINKGVLLTQNKNVSYSYLTKQGAKKFMFHLNQLGELKLKEEFFQPLWTSKPTNHRQQKERPADNRQPAWYTHRYHYTGPSWGSKHTRTYQRSSGYRDSNWSNQHTRNYNYRAWNAPSDHHSYY